MKPKIIAVEARDTHTETLGFFFELPSHFWCEVHIFVQDTNDTWIKYFSKKQKNDVKLSHFSELHNFLESNQFSGNDLAFMNSIDCSWDNKYTEEIGICAEQLAKKFAKAGGTIYQLHMGSNANKNKFNYSKTKKISPFPIQGTTCLRLAPQVRKLDCSKKSLEGKLKFLVLGGDHKMNKSAMRHLSKTHKVIHVTKHNPKERIKNVEYKIDLDTESLMKLLTTEIDYALIDYQLDDRCSGLVIQALSANVPLIINKEYAKALKLPHGLFVEFENANQDLTDKILYDAKKYADIQRNMIIYNAKTFSKFTEFVKPNSGKQVINMRESPKPLANRCWQKDYFQLLWNSAISTELKFKLSKNLFANKEVFIFAAGPSLNLVDIQSMASTLEKSFVICIKQSISLVGEHCDSMIINFCNFGDYPWNEITCPVLWTIWDDKQINMIKEQGAKNTDHFRVTDNGKPTTENLQQTTAGKANWENLLQLPKGVVPWGPGLMYEVCIPLAVHLGVKTINLVGWDIGTLAAEEKTSEKTYLNEHFYAKKDIKMQTKMSNVEMSIVANSTKSLKQWLNDRGINLNIISDRSLADQSIPRLNNWLHKHEQST